MADFSKNDNNYRHYGQRTDKKKDFGSEFDQIDQ